MLALRVGRHLMESGAKAEVVQQGASLVAKGLGAEGTHVRVGYASLAITLSADGHTITRMMGVGGIGVNFRLNFSVRGLCARAAKGGLGAEELEAELDRIVAETQRYPWPMMALAAGVACASFGRLLGVDWLAFLPILVGAAIGQAMRYHLLHRHVNSFVMTAMVAFAASAVAGMGSLVMDSQTVKMAMFAAILLLVPGVPVLNAQTDVMEGHPTLGSARGITVMMALVFMSVGLWLAQTLMGPNLGPIVPVRHEVWHQMLFGAIAAAGFGVLFNFNVVALVWAFAAGALALAVRTLGLDAGWSLEVASFIAAGAVGLGIHLADKLLLPGRVSYAGNTLAVAGCIPMIPGSAAAQGILGLLGLTAQTPVNADHLLLTTAEFGLTVVFTIGAIGTGLTIVTHLLRGSEFS